MHSSRLFWAVLLFPLQQACFKTDMRGSVRTTLAFTRRPIAVESCTYPSDKAQKVETKFLCCFCSMPSSSPKKDSVYDREHLSQASLSRP